MLKIILCLSILLLGLRTFSAEKCERALIPYADEIIASIRAKPLSSRDLQVLVEKVFLAQEGTLFKANDYRLSADHRNFQAHSRRLAEKIAFDGMLKYIEDNNLQKSRSKILTSLRLITRNPYINFWGTATMGITLVSKGTIPINLPDFFFRIKGEDMEVLLLHGLDSPQGREILEKNKFKQEVIRGYSFANKYYTRLALIILTFLVYVDTEEMLRKYEVKTAAEAFEYLKKSLDEHFNIRNKIVTKEDILYKTTIESFKEKFQRDPDYAENRIICLKVYGPNGCP